MTDNPTFLEALTSGLLIQAAWTTIWISLCAQLIGVVIGLVVGPARLSKIAPVRWISGAYVWFFRGSPELLQIIALYSILPLLGVKLSVIMVGLLGLGINEGARMSEITRAAITSVAPGQTDASKVLGMGPLATFRWVILPQAAPLIVAPLGNQMNYMFKTSSLVSTIGIIELLRQTQMETQFTNQPLSIYLATATIYLAITTVWSAFQGWVESRIGVGAAAAHPTAKAGSRRFSLQRLIPLPGQHL